MAIDAITVEIDTTGRSALARRPSGSVELADSAELVNLRRELFADFHARQTGSHDRLAYYQAHLAGTADYTDPPFGRSLRSAVHYNAAGEPDGVATWVNRGWQKPIDVIELIGRDASAQLGLWELLLSIDGIEQVDCRNFNPASALPAALTDPRAVKQIGRRDHIWLRILDVARALAIRPYAAPVDLVLAVTDPLGLSGGKWRLAAASGSVEVTPSDADPDVELGIDVLGACYFGGHWLREFTPDVAGDQQQIQRLDAALRGSEPPWCTTSF